MADSKKVKIDIAGTSYTVMTTEEENYVTELASEISEDINSLMMKNPALSMNDALVLCSIAYLDQYKKENANSDHIRSQLMEGEEAIRKSEKLAKELSDLKKRYGL